MKRILVLLSVVSLMVMMTAMSVAPAFAAPGHEITNPRAILTDLENPDAPYASGSSDSYLNGGPMLLRIRVLNHPRDRVLRGGTPVPVGIRATALGVKHR